MTRRTCSSVLAALSAVVLALPAQAQARPAASASIVVSSVNLTATAAAKGTAPRATVLPGDVLRYTLTFTNATSGAVKNVELRDPVPAGVHFVAGSAHASRADARLEFSADGGKSWSAAPTESVVVDGKTVERAVPADRYTHLRWVVAGAVVPAAVVTASFDTRVGGA